MSTYADFQAQEVSEKTGLIQVDPAKRLIGFSLDSGSVYVLSSFDFAVILSIEDSGVALTEVASKAAITAGTFYNDKTNSQLFLQTSDSANPNGKFLAMVFRLFFSDTDDVALANDLSTGFEVEWLNLAQPVSSFNASLDNRSRAQIGVSIETKGKLEFFNDRDFWNSRYDKLIWENKRVSVYSWNKGLDVSEAKKIFAGIIVGKSWNHTSVSFDIRDLIGELKAEISLPEIKDIATDRVPSNLKEARQRRIYGNVFGYRPTNIDQLVNNDFEGFPLTGTASVTKLGTAITGVSTVFLKELTPGDEIKFTTTAERAYTIESISSDTAAVISEGFEEDDQSGANVFVVPSHPKRYMNREYILAHHKLKQPETTVSGSVSSNRIKVADAATLFEDDPITVGGEVTAIQRFFSVDGLKLTSNLIIPPAVGTAVVRPSVTNVRLDQRDLVATRDYTFDPDAAPSTFTLDELAEFNVAPIRVLSGTSVAFSTATRTVTGVGTSFKADLRPGDWLRVRANAAFFEILQINSDTELILRTLPSYTDTDIGEYKAPNVYTEGEGGDDIVPTVLTCDILGKTKDETKTGDFITTAADIVEDILEEAGLGSEINTSEFDTASIIAPQRLGVVHPPEFSSRKSIKFRDMINRVNKSVFGALFQDEDLLFSYSVLAPNKPGTLLKIKEDDVIQRFQVISRSDQIVKKAIVNYKFQEHDPFAVEPSNSVEEKESDIGKFLTKTDAIKTVDTLLAFQADARIMASRWSFLFELAQTTIAFKTKLQGARSSLTDSVEFSHERLFERFGSTDKRKIGSIQSISKSTTETSMTLTDLNSAFTRVANITPNTAEDFDEATDDEKAFNGYITDNFGMIANDPETHGINVIW